MMGNTTIFQGSLVRYHRVWLATILVPFYSVADVNLREINKVHFASIDILLLRVRRIVELEGQKWKIV